MTGSALPAAREFKKTYKLGTTPIATHKPSQRKQFNDRFCISNEQKFQTVCDEVLQMREQGRPVLVGTRTLEKSILLSNLLNEQRIKHQVLNASNSKMENEIISNAGSKGAVTVATNMAGRGTDIKLCDGVESLGGLHVILTELHDSPRIDRQLIGRAARQGEPGSYRRYFSLEDDVLRLGFGISKAESIRKSGRGNIQTVLKAQRLLVARKERLRRALLYHEKRQLRSLMQMGFDPVVENVV